MALPSSSADVHDSYDEVGNIRRRLALNQVYTSIHNLVQDMDMLKSATVGGRQEWQ
jgi:hypothetical protein